MADLPPPPSAPGAPRRGLRIALILSLALNLLIVGALLGLALVGRGPGGPRGFELGLGPLVQALEPADRRALAGSLRDRPGVRELRPQRREALLEELTRALLAEPFDRAGLEAVLDAQAQRTRDGMAVARGVFLDRLEAMTAAERRAYAERLRRGPGRS